VQVVKEDKFEVKRAYMGLVFLYEDRREVIPVIQNTSTLEYDISSTVKRLTTRTRKKVGFLTGNGEPALSELSRAQQLIAKQYETSAVDVTKGKSVPSDVAVLLVVAPTTRFSEPEKYQIDQYIMHGGKVAFLLNKVDGDLQNRFGRQIDLNLEDMLETYGLKIHPDLIRDAQCASISIEQQQMGFQIRSQVPFPYLPLASKFSKNNMMVKDLQGIVFFFVSSVDTTNLASRNLQGEFLISSSPQSGRQTNVFMFDPLARYSREDFAEKEIPLAVTVAGQFKSMFAGKPVPVDTSAGSIAPAGSPITSSPETRIVLVGDGDFARDKYLANRDNLSFFANIVDYLADDAGLISIRSKDVSMPPLEQTSDATKRSLKLANLIVPPVLVLGYGTLRWRMRLARKKGMGA
jgi:gliding-associated putative ABC transporter substrate-binding component GldG